MKIVKEAKIFKEGKKVKRRENNEKSEGAMDHFVLLVAMFTFGGEIRYHEPFECYYYCRPDQLPPKKIFVKNYILE